MEIRLTFLMIFVFSVASCTSRNTKLNQNPCDILVTYHNGCKCYGSYCLDCSHKRLFTDTHTLLKDESDTFEIANTLCDTLNKLIDSIIVKNNYLLVIDSVVGTDPANFSIMFKQNDSLKNITFNANMGVKQMLNRMNQPALHLKQMLEKRTQIEMCN